MSAVIAALYILCLVALPAFAFAVLVRGTNAALNRLFALLSLSLWAWIASLFAFNLPTTSAEMLLLGRLNFAAAVPAVTLGYCFLLAVARTPASNPVLMWTETAALTGASLLTGWIDKAELVVHGQHLTVYGSIGFPLYLVHIVGYIAAMLITAFRPTPNLPVETKQQLAFLGYGILGTATVALFTNALLPYGFGDFRLINIGTISTVLFLVAVAAAVAVRHLFNIHVIVRTTFVFGGLVALALGFYQLALTSLVHLLPISTPGDRSTGATIMVIVINAFTLDTLKSWLQRLADRVTRNDRNKTSLSKSGAQAEAVSG